jgi:hypothetical protein
VQVDASSAQLSADIFSHETSAASAASVCSMSLKIGGMSTTSLSAACSSEQCGRIG